MSSKFHKKTISYKKEKISIEMNDIEDMEIWDESENITFEESKNSYISESLELSDNANNSYNSSNSSHSSLNNKISEKQRFHRVQGSSEESLTFDSDFDVSSFSTDKGSNEIFDCMKRLNHFEKAIITLMEGVEDKITNSSSREDSVARSESENNSSECSSDSIIFSDNTKNPGTLQISSLCQLESSTRENLTREWVSSFVDGSDKFSEAFLAIDTVTDFDDDFNFTEDLTEDCNSSNTESFAQSESSSSSPSIIFEGSNIESSAECESNTSGSSIIFSEAVTEENYNTHSSLFTRGSLINLADEEFSSIEDVETMYCRTREICSDWEDVIEAGSEFSEGFMNEGFTVEDIFGKPVSSKIVQDANEKWKISMANVKDTPRDPVKISFAPSSSLVVIHHYEKFEEEDQSYDFFALDRLRFQRRINDFSVLISPFLTVEHRTNILLRNKCLL